MASRTVNSGRPCMGFLLDGNTGSAPRNEALFTLGTYLRELGWPREQVEVSLTRAALAMGYKAGKAHHAYRQAVKSAFQTKPNGGFKYRGAGFRNKPGGRYANVLESLCDQLGCPQSCPAFCGVAAGMPGVTSRQVVCEVEPVILA